MTKAEVLDLPPEVHVQRTGHLSPESRRLYTQLDNGFQIKVGTGTVGACNSLDESTKLQQLTSGFVKNTNGVIHTVNDVKERLLEDLLIDLPIAEPVPVFCRFHYDLDAVKRVAEKLGKTYSELSGRRNQLAEWQSGKTSVLGVQVKSGSSGISLVRAAVCVLYSLEHSLPDFKQILGRCHRQGQNRSVTYVRLVVKDSVDEGLYLSFDRNGEIVDYVLDHTRR